MSSLNRVTLIGYLGVEPESRVFSDGTAVCNLRLATTDRWRDRDSGEMKEATEWHRIVLFRRLAEIATQYLKKGAQVCIEGRLRTRKWIDKSGADRYTTEIEAVDLIMLGKRNDITASTDGYLREALGTKMSGPRYEIDDEKIPF